MELYINSVGIISGAGNNISDEFMQQPPAYNTQKLLAVEPDYKAFIPVMQLRRMSKIVRMGVVAAKTAVQNCSVEKMDALSVGTAYGCLQDTESFLGKLIEQDEQMLTPTAFIQSTHNTVGGQIALLSGCYGHNLTYVHRGHSFEHAVINTALYLNDHPGEVVLTGGIDELTDNSAKALQIAGVITQKDLSVDDVLNGNNYAAIGGEGAAFFTVTGKPLSDKFICIRALEVFKANDEHAATNKVKQFAARNNTQPDVLLIGNNGDAKYKPFYNAVQNELYKTAAVASFKQLCGEYPTASSFAIGILMNGVPDFVYTNSKPVQVKNVVLVNNAGPYYSCWLLELSV